MLAAVFGGPGKLELTELEQPHAGPGELVLKVGANTVCGTDGRILRGEKSAGIDIGVVLGHEVAGYVVEVGAGVQGFDIGDLVGVLPTVPCGRCYFCARGQEHLCIDSEIFGYRINGGLAEYLKIPAHALTRGGIYRVSAELTAVEVALAEPLGCVINGVHNYKPTGGDVVLVLGAGPIGLLHTQMCRHLGASEVIVSDPSPSRRELAEQLGATKTLNPLDDDLVAAVRDWTNGAGADVAVACIGRPELLQQAFLATRKGGRVNAFAGFPKGVMAEVDPNLIHYGELTVTGASNAGRAHHEMALKLISDRVIDVKTLHSHTFPLTEVHAGIEFAALGEGIKVAIVPE